MPAAPGWNDAETVDDVLVVDGASVPGPPILAPPLLHPVALGSGPQTANATVPVGLPPVELPPTEAPSVFVDPRVILFEPGVVVVVVPARVTVKHSVLLPSEDAA